MATPQNFADYLKDLKKQEHTKKLRAVLARMPKVKREQRSPSGYIKHKEYCAVKYLKKSEYEELAAANMQDSIYTTWSMVFDLIETAQSNPYFVSRELTDALKQTDIPEVSHAFQTVLPVLEVILPLGALVDEEGLDITSAVIIDCLIAKNMFDDPLKFTASEEAPRYMICMFNEVGALMVIPVYEDGRDPIPVEGRLSRATDEVKARLKELRDICMNLLLLFEAHPEYVGSLTTAPSSTPSSIKKNRSSLLPPRIIGTSTFDRRTIEVATSLCNGSTGRQMPPHMRRGHWRRTRFGSDVIQYKWNWIKPVAINF